MAAGGRGGGPYVLGLTGSIGMGKSTVSAMFVAEGVPLYDADAAVHRLYAPGGAAVGPVAAAFGPAVLDAAGGGGISRPALGAAVLGDEAAMRRLEAIVHPLVEADRAAFMATAAESGAPLVVADIPLLFEKGYQSSVDAVVVVSAPPDTQRRRCLARPGMTPEKLDAILARQVPDAEKRARADFVLDTSADVEATRMAVRDLIQRLRCDAAAGRARGADAGVRPAAAAAADRPADAAGAGAEATVGTGHDEAGRGDSNGGGGGGGVPQGPGPS